MNQPAKIAIVDDDEGIRDALRDLVTSLGYVAVEFPDAEAFLATPERHRVDCLILDVRMPGMNGLELQERLNSESSPPPIIFMTSFGDDSTRRRALAGGAVCFLGKPVADTRLIRCIEDSLARVRAEKPGAEEPDGSH